MKNSFVKLRNIIIGFFYRNIFKKIFFRIDEERIHNIMIQLGKVLGGNLLFRKAVSLGLNYSNPLLKQNICNIIFENPLGLAAGFDKNARMIRIMPNIGFGFTEVGSITGQLCLGNSKPRLWRLPKSRSIIVNYGLKNDGAEVIAERLNKEKYLWRIPVGISIAKTNSPETIDIPKGLDDYLKGIREFLDIGDYLVLNISCPNTYGGESFTDPEALDMLLKEISRLNIKKPIFIKMAPDFSVKQIDKIIELVEQYHLAGFICSNLTKDRSNLRINPAEIKRVPEDIGSFSGKPVEKMTNNLIAYIYQKTKGKKIIIGCGGIFSAEDAYKKIKLGASLLQLITGMIFEGPQLISQINLGLCHLLKKDGFKNINQAVGIDLK